jgi:hypothetical protein
MIVQTKKHEVSSKFIKAVSNAILNDADKL